jgi:hypothetical protein
MMGRSQEMKILQSFVVVGRIGVGWARKGSFLALLLRAIDYIFDNSMVFIGPNLPHPIMYFV